MLRRCIAFFLIFSVLTINFGRCFIYAGFGMNRSYIAAKLCVNRTKPKMHCNGKCYLAKKLKQEEEKEKSEERQIQKNHIQEGLLSQSFQLSAPCSLHIETLFAEYRFNLPNRAFSIFHPPKSLS